ncbi:TRAP transporter large permease [Falsiroseomonas sp.]|uniref:TRAP transporter large permease n=1 Tax=Falsiroseomonas sp. TaxID=2870721 RepID=UPI00271DAEEB|nr:TRAP transporter large permease [Falsiroseomonas sp.]MDO9499193.1 TRAP transporter large permease [Falsiroseomonas sp.]
MSAAAWILSAGFAGMLVIGMPFAFALGLATLAALIVSDIDTIAMAQKMISGSQSFSLLAIPFFVLAGDLMTAGGLSRRLVAFANTLVRHVTGGLGMVAVIAAVFFAAISGSAPATTAAIGAIMIPEMERRGYDRAFATALAISAGIIGPLIPPSIPFVIWGVIAEQSIARLFLSGVIPGFLLAVGLMAICWIYARRHKIDRESRASLREILATAWDSKWALGGPFIILGGIYGGIFTPTEAAVVGAFYALVVGLLVHREFTLRDLPAITLSALRTTAIVMFIITAAAGFGWLVAFEQLPPKIAGLLTSVSDESWVVLMVINALLLAIGAVMDNVAAMVILGGVLVNTGNQLGLDPIHLGAIVTTNLTVGMATPPFGYALFVGAAVSGLSVGRISRALWPMLLVMGLVLLAVTYIPMVSLALQSLL